MDSKRIRQRFDKLLSLLHVTSDVGGLEITDQVLRLAYLDKETWRFVATVLGPGVMQRGAVKDPVTLARALQELRSQVPFLHGHPGRKMTVVVSLGSANVYTQSFTLPLLQGEELKKAIDLNVQMSSPDDLAKSYFGSRVLASDAGAMRIQIASAFIERSVVDDLIPILFEAGFVAIDVESRAISLARTIRERTASLDSSRSYLLLDIDDTGIDFLVLRNGELYFEYQTPWTDLGDAKGQVTMERFNEAVTANFRQVFNFYHQRWQEELGGVLVVAVAFGKEASSAIAGVTTLPVLSPAFNAGEDMQEWLAAYGAALRGGIGKGEISLSGDVAADAYHKQQTIAFLDFWSVLVPVTLGILVATLALAYNFLGGITNEVVASGAPGGQGKLMSQIAALQASSTAFNNDVSLALAAQFSADKSHDIFDRLDTMAASSSVTLSRVTFQGASAPVFVSGIASTADDIVQFRDYLTADPAFTGVNLPLSAIQPSGSMYSFSLTFSLSGHVIP